MSSSDGDFIIDEELPSESIFRWSTPIQWPPQLTDLEVTVRLIIDRWLGASSHYERNVVAKLPKTLP